MDDSAYGQGPIPRVRFALGIVLVAALVQAGAAAWVFGEAPGVTDRFDMALVGLGNASSPIA